MFKVIAMMKRKQGISLDEFRHHYETIHAPMGLKSLANTKRYFRRYLHPISELGMDSGLTQAITEVAANPGVLGQEGTEFDVITEMWFENRAEFEKAFRAMGTPEHLKMSTEDSMRFMDMSKSRMYTVDEAETDFNRK